MADDRISKLSERFRTHSVGRRPASRRTRERHSFYLDGELVGRLDRAYRDLNHALHPQTVSKSLFLETLMEYGLERLPELKTLIAQTSSADRPADNT